MHVTMKKVAQNAGVSVSTVSIIVNGHQKERHIPQSTVDKVRKSMQQLGYKPNRNAQQLRSARPTNLSIALCFPLDPNTGLIEVLPALISYIQKEIVSKKLPWNLVIKPFQNDKADQLIKTFKKGNYDAALIAAASSKDIHDLENSDLLIPIVLLNRISDRLSTVGVDPQLIAQTAITLLQAKHIKTISVVLDANNYSASNTRMEAIISRAKKVGIKVFATYQSQYSNESGTKVAQQMIAKKDFHPVIAESDLTAIGMVYYFNHHNVQIPQQLKLLTLSVLEQNFTAYQTPSISTISLSTSDIAKESIAIIQKQLNNKNIPQHILLSPELHLRETFN
ncbi:LacI family DNA-binding transcriptional regulator [uncultured Lactobacillus sp.]|uniref:LacI family DNA-binding transcriptional regulator n=1 Tax=uncultured Lactobacillus sp. TaxID=153152 RepID=UPI0028062B27|nr:LacI family DNA-binding transcriptional regulator [uncultured Lactobacillus sp.]